MHWIDITLVIASIIFVMLFGLKFAHKQDSTNSYFAAGGSVPAWAIGMSIFATLISSVTFLAYPGAAYGGSWILLVQGLMVPIVLVGMIWFIVPLFRKAIKLSTYEYFERRFGFGARLYGSIAFLLTHFSKLGTVFFLVSLAISQFMGWDIYLVIIIIGIACLWASQDNESDSFEEPSSVIQSSSSISTPEASSSDVSQDITTESNTSSISIAANEEAPTEEEAATEETATEAATTVQEDNALTAVNAKELPQELSRKERRACEGSGGSWRSSGRRAYVQKGRSGSPAESSAGKS